jgi:hypothetical protein
MANGNPLKWKLKLTAEVAPGESVECDVAQWERADEATMGSLGLSIAEGKIHSRRGPDADGDGPDQTPRTGSFAAAATACGRKLPNNPGNRSPVVPSLTTPPGRLLLPGAKGSPSICGSCRFFSCPVVAHHADRGFGCMAKPFRGVDLLARVGAVLKHTVPKSSGSPQFAAECRFCTTDAAAAVSLITLALSY